MLSPMRQRGWQIALLATCLVATVAAGIVVVSAQRELQSQRLAEDDLVGRLRGLRHTLDALHLAQAAAVTTGQPRATWLERCDTLLAQAGTEAAAVRALVRAADPMVERALGTALERLGTVDASIRRNLDQEESVLAADVVFGDASSAVQNMLSLLDRIDGANRTSMADARLVLQQRQATALLAIAVLWTLGGLVLVRSSRPRAEAAPAAAPAEPAPVARPVVAPARPTFDPAPVATLCHAIARIADASALPDILARTAELLKASGLVVWVVDGERIAPALAHGYPASALRHFGSMTRDAGNPTATAWRTGVTQVVVPTGGSAGAVVVPMVGPQGCVGVLALEMGQSIEPFAASTAGIVAAQLASVVAPSASVPASAAPVEDVPPMAASGSR
jgi:hypothetical protein